MNDAIRRIDDKIESVTDKLDKLSEKTSDIDKNLAEHKATFAEHAKQDERIQQDISTIKDEVQSTNIHIAEYNAQLKIHIAGVDELRRSNDIFSQQLVLLQQGNSIQRIESEKRHEMYDARLKVAEQPIQWFVTTGKYLKWITVAGSASAVIAGLVKFIMHKF